jgi:hypothetical protein
MLGNSELEIPKEYLVRPYTKEEGSLYVEGVASGTKFCHDEREFDWIFAITAGVSVVSSRPII